MSLLERLGRGHLDDRAFARIWTDGGTHPHLAGCAECRTRFDQFEAWIRGVGDELCAEADRAFPTERLVAQQAQIARRLEALERPARVIAFPKAARAVMNGHSHGRRWITVGVAAGLIAGVGLGGLLERSLADQRPTAATVHFTASQANHRASGIRPVSLTEGDEEFLDGAEAMGPRVKELRALDDLTPHTRDLIARK